MSTNTSDVAEDKGSIPYVEAWDGETGGAERLVSEVSDIASRISKAVEANARHEIGGGRDVAGKWQAAVEAIQAAGEATDAHAAALHTAWDTTNEKLRGHAASSAQDLAGAH